MVDVPGTRTNSSAVATRPASALTERIGTPLADTASPCSFIFNNRRYHGFAGDTLASALLANGQRLVGRSFKYHRPRGIVSCGSEEPNALMTIGTGGFAEPNTRATVTELYDGLEARSQNHAGPLAFDVMAINDRLSRFLGAGFYYKTFMWPARFWEKLYEPVIRRAAGLGKLSGEPDPSVYDKGFLHTDVLVIGAGPAGLSAALAAGRAGQRVLLVDEDFVVGGRLNAESYSVDDLPGATAAQAMLAELERLPSVRLLTRTTLYGVFDHGIYGALERCTDHRRTGYADGSDKPRQILWRIRARQSILCSGAIERSIVFENNDRPGIMLAGAVRSYLLRFGVSPGRATAIFTNNDDGWRTASDLLAQGQTVAAVIDTRAGPAPMSLPGVPVYLKGRVTNTGGRLGLSHITLSGGERIDCDCLAVSGGWSPNVHLTCHHRGRPVWDEQIAAFIPGTHLPQGMQVAGAAAGQLSLGSALQFGHAAAVRAITALGGNANVPPPPSATSESTRIEAFWQVPTGRGRAWIDLQNDVTVKDIALADRDGFRAVEHLKRYTTLGMATDQGKTSNLPGLAIMAERRGQSIADTGTTIFRPPYTPVPIAAFAGRSRGTHFRPLRHTPSHAFASERNAVFVNTGNWLRAQWYPLPGETHWRDSVDREVLQTRASVGVCDVSTLGKIDIQGRDAGAFLDFVYANTFSTLAVGRVRYGLMLRDDGLVMDDGTTARLGDQHYVMTTTTANAVSVFRHLEFCRQCLQPSMDVHLISHTEQWAQFSVAGPDSRALLQKLVDSPHAIDNESLPFMGCMQLTVCGGTPARLFRISFSGERAYEIAVSTRYGNALMRAMMEAGREFGVVPYGTEALGVMRVEKGHAAGNELDGRTSARQLGLGRMVSKKKDCIGNIMSERAGLNLDREPELVGFIPVNQNDTLVAGAHFVAEGAAVNLSNDEGWMSSVAYSPSLAHSIGLGFIEQGRERLGEMVRAVNPLAGNELAVRICSPHFIDPDGERLRG